MVTPPLVLELQSFECWQNLGNVKIGFNLEPISSGQITLSWQNFAPKWSSFHVLCDDFQIVGDTPWYRLVIQLVYSYKRCLNLNQPYLLIKDDSGGGIHTKMTHILYDSNIVVDIPYKFGAIWLWSQNMHKVQPFVCLNEEDSCGGTHTKTMYILCMFGWYSHCQWDLIKVESHLDHH